MNGQHALHGLYRSLLRKGGCSCFGAQCKWYVGFWFFVGIGTSMANYACYVPSTCIIVVRTHPLKISSFKKQVPQFDNFWIILITIKRCLF